MRNACVFFLLSHISLLCSQQTFPEIIDFGKFKSGVHNQYYEEAVWQFGQQAFNWAPETTPFFLLLKRDYHIDAAVETGTFWGGTTMLFSLVFDEVHTIEIQEDTYNTAKQRLQEFPNVHCHLGSSETVLKKLLPSIKDKRVLFYLDAHWLYYWPLLQELEEIALTHKDNCIIVIDDFKVPGRGDIPYDSWGTECSYEYVKNALSKVFTEYSMHFLIPKNVYCRAKCIAIPKKWVQNPK